MKKSLFLAFSVLLAACTTDLYEEKTDPTPTPTPPEHNGGVTEGPNLSTITETTLTVYVNDEYAGLYTYGVEIYDVNPLFTKDAKPLYVRVAKGNEPLTMKIDLPQALTQIYVLQKDPTQGQTVIALALSGEVATLSCDFRTQKITSKSAMRSVLRSENEIIVDPDSPYYDIPEYTFRTGLDGGITTYVIATGSVVNFEQVSVDENVILRVEGTLNCEKFILVKNSTLINKNKVIVSDLIAEENSVIENICNISAERFESRNGAKINLGTSSIFKCGTINSVGTIFSLGNYAILRATGKAAFGNGMNEINGVGNDRCLLDFDVMVAGNGNKDKTLVLSGNIDLLCNTIEYPIFDTPNSVHYVNKNSSVNIPSGECTGEGNVINKPGPSDIEYDKIPNGNIYTFAMEDNWPALGDYDMNDLVLSIKSKLVPAKGSNNITSIELLVCLRAVGGTMQLGAGLQFDNVSSSKISMVQGETANVFFSPGFNGVESGEQAVLPLFDDAHFLLTGETDRVTLNTYQNQAEIRNLYYKVIFTEPIDPEFLSISNLNFFIVNRGSSTSRSEVHVAGFKQSAKVSGIAGYYTPEGLAWGIMIPHVFQFPREVTPIMTAYPEFEAWSKSGRFENKEWYMNPVEGRVMPIYQEENICPDYMAGW